MTQTQVADYLGYENHVPISHWETAKNFPSLEAFVMVAGLYGASADWLLWGDGMVDSIDERVRRIPKVLRDGLLMTLHDEISKTEDAARRLPSEMRGDVVKDTDARLAGWSAKNLAANAPRRAPKRRDHNQS